MKTLLSLLLVTAMQAAPAPGSSVQVISREMMSLVEEPKQVLAHTAAQWAALWRAHAGDTPAPPVDFGSRMVVAIFLGSRSSAGFAADVTAVRAGDGALIVEWQERRPARDQVAAQVLTRPAVIVSVPKFDGPVRFEKAVK